MAGQTAAVVAEPILNYNFSFIDAYLEQSLQDQDMLSAAVLDAQGNPISQKSVERSAKKTFVISQPIVLGDTSLGELKIEYAGRTIDAWMRKSLLVIPSLQLAMLVGVAGILILLLNFNIRKPVAEINRVIGKVTAGDLTAAMPRFRDDDIGVFAQGISFLVEKLAQTIARINAISTERLRCHAPTQYHFRSP